MSNIDWRKSFSKLAQNVEPPQISWLMAQALEVPGIISLAAGFVDQASLPYQELVQEIQSNFSHKDLGQTALQYGTTRGDAELRSILIQDLYNNDVLNQNSNINADDMLIGSGSQQVLYLLSEALLDEDDIVLLEAPTYFVVLGAFRARGAQTIGLDTDEQGLKPESLEHCLEHLASIGKLNRVKMLYCMTYAANPTGVSYHESRTKAIWDILQKYKSQGHPILFVEDAAYRRLSFNDKIPHPMKYFDIDNEQVIYSESFSKTFSPGMRLGFCVGPKTIIDKMTDIKGNHDFGSSNFCQLLIKQLIKNGIFAKQIDTLKQTYWTKWEIVNQILKEHLPPEAHWITPQGGFYTWLTLPEEFDTGPQSAVFQEALTQKVLYVPGALCYSTDRPESQRSTCIRLAFGLPNEEQLKEGCKRLGEALQIMVHT